MIYADGYDISRHQAFYVNHQGAKDAGMDFAIFRASGGTLKDGTFLWNMKMAKKAGIPVGAYHYIYPRRPAVAAMEILYQQVRDAGGVDMKVWADVECTYPAYTLPIPQHQEAVEERLELMYDRFGKENVGIYTSATKWERTVGGYVNGASTLDLWVAHYTSRISPHAPLLPRGWRDWTFWQYTDKGRVPWYRDGKYSIDLNRFNGDEQGLAEYVGNDPPPSPQHVVTVTHPIEVDIKVVQN